MSEAPAVPEAANSIHAQSTSGRVFDLAILLTAATGVSYVLAWTYWYSYFNGFGLPSDFIEIRVETVIGSVWPLSVMYLILAFSTFGEDHHIRSMREGRMSCLTLFVFMWFLVLPFFLGEIEGNPGAKVGAVLWGAVFLSALFTIRKRWSPLRGHIQLNKPEEFLFPAMIFALIVTVGFFVAGARDAQRLANGRTKTRVRIETRDAGPLPSELVLVATTRDRVILVEPKKNNASPEAIVLNASDVVKLTAYKKP